MNEIKKYRFGNSPSLAYLEGEPLDGFDPEDLSAADYDSPRGQALYDALGVPVDDEDFQLGKLINGCWALVGLDLEGWPFAVEEDV